MSLSFTKSKVITTNTTTVVLASIGTATQSEGVLHSVMIGASSPAGGTVLIYDNATGTGTPVAALATPASQPLCAILDIQLVNGLSIVTAGFTTTNVTAIYR